MNDHAGRPRGRPPGQRGAGGPQGRERGRGRRGGGGRPRGRGDHHVQNALSSDDEEEAEEMAANAALLGMGNIEEFPVAPADDDEMAADLGELIMEEPDGPNFVRIDLADLGNEDYRVPGRVFDRGNLENELKIERFENYSPTELVLYFSQGLFDLLRDCTNEQADAGITMRDLYVYHAHLLLMTLVRLDSVNDFWYPPEMMEWKQEAAQLKFLMPRRRFYHIRSKLRAYKGEDDVDGKGPGWKVSRATEEMNRIFRTTMSHPDMNISIDEGMAAASSSRNPIYTKINNKPLEGFRFFIAVDFRTKCAIGLIADLKQFTAANSVGHPGGYVGHIVADLLETMKLPGIWYRFWLDNFYNTLALVIYVLARFSYCIGGTMQRRNTTDVVYFGTARTIRPSLTHPKGTLRIAKKVGSWIFEYAWIDSAAVYFIDCALGPGEFNNIHRRNHLGDPVPYPVPQMIVEYNKFMGGVDVFDQVRKCFGVDTLHATSKYTLRMFEVLWSMAVSQAYNVYRYVNLARRARQMNQTKFKTSVIKGLLNHPVVGLMLAVPLEHNLVQFDGGTRPDGSNRRIYYDCRFCPNNIENEKHNRHTTWYCTECKVAFHPGCFVVWHREHQGFFLHTKRLRILEDQA